MDRALPAGASRLALGVALLLPLAAGRALRPQPDPHDHRLHYAPHGIPAHHASRLVSLLETTKDAPALVCRCPFDAPLWNDLLTRAPPTARAG